MKNLIQDSMHKKREVVICILKKAMYISRHRFRGSSMVEHATVNRRVAGSSPARGAKKRGCA